MSFFRAFEVNLADAKVPFEIILFKQDMGRDAEDAKCFGLGFDVPKHPDASKAFFFRVNFIIEELRLKIATFPCSGTSTYGFKQYWVLSMQDAKNAKADQVNVVCNLTVIRDFPNEEEMEPKMVIGLWDGGIKKLNSEGETIDESESEDEDAFGDERPSDREIAEHLRQVARDCHLEAQLEEAGYF